MAATFTRISLIAGLALLGARAQPLLSLAEASRRTGTDLVAAHRGETVTVRGVVAAGPVFFPEYVHVAIQDAAGAGLTLEAQRQHIPSLRPGTRVQVSGLMHDRAGLPVLRVDQLS